MDSGGYSLTRRLLLFDGFCLHSAAVQRQSQHEEQWRHLKDKPDAQLLCSNLAAKSVIFSTTVTQFNQVIRQNVEVAPKKLSRFTLITYFTVCGACRLMLML